VLGAALLALAASATWGTADFAAGLMTRSMHVGVVLLIAQGIGLVLAAAVVVASGAAVPGTGPALASLGSGVGAIGGLACFYRGLATGTMSVVAPVAATGVAIPVVAGVLGGDRLAVPQVAGMVAAVIGVVLVARVSDAGRTRVEARAHRGSVLLALAAACGFGLYFLLAHIGARGGVAWLLLLGHTSTLVGACVILVAARVPPRLPDAGGLGVLLLAGAFDFSATALYGIANRHGQLSIVAVAGSLYPVATVLLARTFLRERLAGPQAVGVVLALIGVALIAT